MKRVLLMNFGSLGDIHPFIGMGLILKEAGIEVVFGSNRAHVPRIQAAGFEAHGIGPDLRPDDPELIRIVMDPRKGPEKLHRDYIFPASEQSIQEGLALAERSDLIITGILGYFVPTLAELTKKPWGMAMLAPMAYFSAYDPPELPAIPFLKSLKFLGPGILSRFYRAIFSLGDSWAEPLQQARLRRGLSRQANPCAPGTGTSGALNLALFSKHFAAPQPDWPSNLVQPGYMFYDGSGAEGDLSPELERFLDAGDPPLLVTLGSTNVFTPGQIFEIFHEAVNPLGRRALMIVGANQVEELRAKYANSAVGVFGYAPYGKLMSRCAAIVHQGGAGTTGQGLRAGKPAIIVGSANDQLDNARHLENIGAGIKLPLNKLSTKTLGHAITRATSAETSAQAEAIGRKVRAESPAQVLIEAVSRFL